MHRQWSNSNKPHPPLPKEGMKCHFSLIQSISSFSPHFWLYLFLRFTSSKRNIFIMNWNWHEWGKTRLKSIQNSFFLAQWIIFYHHHLHWFRCSSPAVLFRNHFAYRSNMNTFNETLYFLELAWNSFCSIQIYTYIFKAYRTYAQVFDIPTSYNDDIIDNGIWFDCITEYEISYAMNM